MRHMPHNAHLLSTYYTICSHLVLLVLFLVVWLFACLVVWLFGLHFAIFTWHTYIWRGHSCGARMWVSSLRRRMKPQRWQLSPTNQPTTTVPLNHLPVPFCRVKIGNALQMLFFIPFCSCYSRCYCCCCWCV